MPRAVKITFQNFVKMHRKLISFRKMHSQYLFVLIDKIKKKLTYLYEESNRLTTFDL